MAPLLDRADGLTTASADTIASAQDQMRIIKQGLIECLPGIRVFLDVDEQVSRLELVTLPLIRSHGTRSLLCETA